MILQYGLIMPMMFANGIGRRFEPYTLQSSLENESWPQFTLHEDSSLRSPVQQESSYSHRCIYWCKLHNKHVRQRSLIKTALTSNNQNLFRESNLYQRLQTISIDLHGTERAERHLQYHFWWKTLLQDRAVSKDYERLEPLPKAAP